METQHDHARLVEAQLATATAHPVGRSLCSMKAAPVDTWMPPVTSCTCNAPSPSPRQRLSAQPHSPRSHCGELESCCCGGLARRRSASSSTNTIGRHTVCPGGVPAVGGMPHGSGRSGPEGCGSGARPPARLQTRSVSSALPSRPSKESPALKPSQALRKPALGQSPQPAGLESALGEALQGLDSARSALADAARQLSQEGRMRSSEAYRVHRLEQVMAASLGGFGRELQALRADSARRVGGRREGTGTGTGQKTRCRSCTRC